MNIEEQARIRLIIDGKEAKSELTALETRISEISTKQKEHARGTKEYKELNSEIKQLEKSYKLVSERMDINSMTTKQLIKYQRELGSTIRNEMVEGTEEFVAAQRKLTEVNTRVAHLRGLLRETNKELEPQPGLWTRIKDQAVAFLAAFSMQRVLDYLIQLGKSAFATVNSMDSLHLALKNVLETNDEYEQSLDFLKNLSMDYGQSIEVLTKSYTGFIAASKNSNLSLSERQKIYESVIKAGSAMKLSNDQIEGSLLALSQMFSKGTVQAEELRGQLGERIPGAFGIMADALEVNEKQLNKMLEQGEILAAEALPKFAKALEELYGDKAQSNLLSYDGSWNRLISKLTTWAVVQNENIGITRGLAKGINFVTDNLGLLVKLLVTGLSGIVSYTLALKASTIAMGVKNGLLTASRFLYGQVMLARVAATGSTEAFTFAELKAAAGARTFNAALSANPLGIIIPLITAAVAGYQLYMNQQEKMREAQAALNNEVAEAIAPLKLQQAEFERLSNAVLDGNTKLDDRQKALDTLKAKYPDNLKGINTLKDAESKLGGVIRATNADFVARAKLLEAEVKMAHNNALATKAIQDKILLESQLKTASTNRVTMVTGTAGYLQTYDSEAEKITKLIAVKDALVLKTQQANARMAESSEELLKKMNYSYESQIKGGNKVVEEAKKSNSKKEKDLLEHAKKVNKIISELDAAWIESEKDEVARNKKKLMAKYEQELEAFEKLGASEEEYVKYQLDLKTKLERDIADVDAKAWQKEAETRKKYSDEMQKEIEKFTKKIPPLHERAAVEVGDIEERLTKKIKAFVKEVEDRKAVALNKEIEQQRLREELIRQGFVLAGVILNQIEANLDKQLSLASTATEKAVIENKKAWLGVADNAMNALSQLANGNVVGAIVGGLGALFGALDNWVSKSARLMEARLADLREELRAAGEEFLKYTEGYVDGIDTEGIEKAYESLLKIYEMPVMRLDFGEYDSYERRIQQELEIANSINENYDLALQREEEYSKTVIGNIERAYTEEVSRINAKYDYLNQMANQQYDAETIAIKENLSEQLLALITNEDSKLSVRNEYAEKQSMIMRSFALADQEITADTDQATIDAINAAIDARNKALVDLQNWYNNELEYVVNSEEQKRKEYSTTEQLKKDAEEAIANLAILATAEAINREKEKNQELVAAEQLKNEMLEAEATRYNDVLTQLGLERDAALMESFTILKELMTAGYDEIMQKALEAQQAGKITADQFNELAAKLMNIQNLVNAFDWSKLVIPDFDWNFDIPRFATGTEYVDPKGRFPNGVDTVPAMLNKGERVLPTGDNALLGNMSNAELMRRVMSTMNTTGMASRIANSSIGVSGQLPTVVKSNQAALPENSRYDNSAMVAELQTGFRTLSEKLDMLNNIDYSIKNKPVVSTKMLSDHAAAEVENAKRSIFR